jgi:hypothetical protein
MELACRRMRLVAKQRQFVHGTVNDKAWSIRRVHAGLFAVVRVTFVLFVLSIPESNLRIILDNNQRLFAGDDVVSVRGCSGGGRRGGCLSLETALGLFHFQPFFAESATDRR